MTNIASYWIGYDLKADEDYESLISEIKSLGTKWWHYLDSTWIVVTSLNADQIVDRLKDKLKSSDRLLVMKTTTKYQGWLSEEAWKWIRENVTD